MWGVDPWFGCGWLRSGPTVKQTKTKNHTVERGLFLVRYEAAADTASPPTVTVSSETAGEHQVAVITDPDVIYGVLSRPGDCLVLKALQRGVVRIEVAPQSERGSTDATVQVERLLNGKPPQDEVSHQVKRPDRVKQVSRAGLSDEDELPSDGLEIIGHVARRGDVSIKAGEWLAGPGAPSQIEGVSFFWPGKPDAVTLTYSVEMGGRGVRPTRVVRQARSVRGHEGAGGASSWPDPCLGGGGSVRLRARRRGTVSRIRSRAFARRDGLAQVADRQRAARRAQGGHRAQGGDEARREP